MNEAKSKALKRKLEEKEKKCKHCGSKKHMSNDCDEKEGGYESEGKKEKREEE